MISKCCTKYARKFGKVSSGHTTRKFSVHSSPKKGNAKECSHYPTTALISHVSKVMLKTCQASLQQYMNQELQLFKLNLKKAEELEIKLPTSLDRRKRKEFQSNIYFCFIDYTKAFVWITINCGKFLKRWKYQTTRPAY